MDTVTSDVRKQLAQRLRSEKLAAASRARSAKRAASLQDEKAKAGSTGLKLSCSKRLSADHIDELLPTRIEPVARLDNNDKDDYTKMTKKMEKWFHVNGRPHKKAMRCEGRQWIEAIECGAKRREEYENFDLEKVLRPHGLSNGSPTGKVDAFEEEEKTDRQMKQMVKVREEEERAWAARHKPRCLASDNTSGAAVISRSHHVAEAVSLRSRSSKRNSIGSSDEHDNEAGRRLREKALWLPVSENHVPRNSRPAPDQCGAVLFNSSPTPEPFTPKSAKEEDEEAEDVSSHRDPALIDAPSDAAGRALDLWTGIIQKPLAAKQRKNSLRERARPKSSNGPGAQQSSIVKAMCSRMGPLRHSLARASGAVQAAAHTQAKASAVNVMTALSSKPKSCGLNFSTF